MRDLQKKLNQVEADMTRTKKDLEDKTKELEEKEKANTAVSISWHLVNITMQ